jgi:iron complex outermembrane receptor protein
MRIPRNQLSLAVQGALLLAMLPFVAAAQDAPAAAKTDAKAIGTVEVTGSRIKQTDAVTAAPVAIISRAQIDKSGATSIGQFLQQLTSSGKALNAQFNSSGNFGYPPDGGGIGAGSAQVDLRNLESKRVLVLVDGIRWVNESSASGVSGSADLNTIPLDIVERIEVLEDGASAIYGSDAIAGVVNIITRKNFDGAQVHTKYGQYSGFGGDTKEASITIGGSSDKVSGVFSASYFDQQSISSGEWAQSSFAPIGRAGPRHGSSATPQGRFTFCDPRISDPNQYGFCDAAGNMWFDITLNNGALPNYNNGDPTGPGGTYHDWSGADRFAYAPYNLLLTPQTRKSLFGSVQYDITESTTLHAKALYNTRQSENQAAPEPIFVGPFAGTGGIADTIVISHLNPYNPFGIDLNPATNFGWVTKRPIELAPRIFTQDVDTSYFNLGLDGSLSNGFSWDMNYVHSENKATQTFYNGFNVAKLKIALGDPAICAANPGCVPLDLFGGETRPITQAMLGYIKTTQIDSSKQVLDLFSANLTGDLWAMGGDRNAAFATGVEYRRYQGKFNPDPLRQTGESQDSFAAPVSASYSVKEFYGEVQLPWADSFSTDFALRYSDYSTFGSATTGKAGFRWQPIEDLVIRGTYSTGFRAPNIGELYGLTQFGATLTDPCSNYTASGNATLISRCQALGVPSGYEQANTQITTFTGGNPALDPEKSDNYNIGAVWSPSWAEDLSWSKRLDFEFDYYNYKVDKAIQAPDIQALLDGCVIGTITGPACSGFTRQSSGNLNPPTDFLSNLGTIKTSGIDLKSNWLSPEFSWGTLSGSLQATHTINYSAVDAFGNVAQRAVGIEVDNSAIPSWQTNTQFGWTKGDWAVNWTVRYISKVIERCSDFRDGRSDSLTNLGLCSLPDTTDNSKSRNELAATVYNDAQISWKNAFTVEGMQMSLGVNNLFDKDPPECTSCTLNGYDAGTYDLPGRFWYVSLDYKF